MVKYTIAAAVLLTLHHRGVVEGFPVARSPAAPSSVSNSRPTVESRRSAAISAAHANNNETDRTTDSSSAISPSDKFKSTSASYLDSLSSGAEDDDHDDELAIISKRRTVFLDKKSGLPRFIYKVTLPIISDTTVSLHSDTLTTNNNNKSEEDAVAHSLGLSLRQVSQGGILTKFALDLDTLRFQSFADETRGTAIGNDDCEEDEDFLLPQQEENKESCLLGSVEMLKGSRKAELDERFNGLIVSSVVRGGLAWNAGVRVGDALLATSATLGDKMWPKSTFDGVRSAISSRRVLSSKMQFQFQRSGAHMAASEVVEEFELSIARPLGIHIEQSDDGFVRVAGFTDQVNPELERVLRIGDRIVAVDSPFGSKLWPVSSVEGVVSACTTRLPGQSVRLRFERIVEVGEWTTAEVGNVDASSVLTGTVDGFRKFKLDIASSSIDDVGAKSSSIKSIGSRTHKLLLSRCRDVLRRYTSGYVLTTEDVTLVPAMVADRVLEALADASAPLDGKTLALVMNAYISCQKPEAAIKAFEAAVGVAGDGSTKKVDVVIGSRKSEYSQFVADVTALNLYTATALLRAHALLGDVKAARRVLAAMEGHVKFKVGGVNAASWPGARSVIMKVDTRCYNIVLAAAAKGGGKIGIDIALDVFDSMAEPFSRGKSGKPEKNIVSYNTLIGAFAKAGRSQDAFTVFYSMKQAGVKPDKFSYTSLIKASAESGDVRGGHDLLKEMNRGGIEADVITYNTLIKALCDRSKLFDSKQLVTDMESRGILPDSMTYGLLMNGLLKANKPGPCLTLFESACSDESTVSLTENVQLFTTAITAAASLGDHERALDLVSRMTKAKVRPNIKTLTALMGACLSAGKTSFALEVYKKIDKPDGYAMSLAFRGYCDMRDFDFAVAMLSKQNDAAHQMSGKQIMSSYNCLIRAALAAKDYDMAETSMTAFLRAGYIPSKNTFRTIIEGLDLVPSMKGNRLVLGPNEIGYSVEKFDYLLTVLDALAGRKIPCDGFFYSAILFEGARIGGLRKKVCCAIASARPDSLGGGDQINTGLSLIECAEDGNLTWEQLLQNYADYKDCFDEMRLPIVRVRFSDSEVRQILLAEQAVAYSIRREKRRQSVKLP